MGVFVCSFSFDNEDVGFDPAVGAGGSFVCEEVVSVGFCFEPVVLDVEVFFVVFASLPKGAKEGWQID